jgi:hypothetical protein
MADGKEAAKPSPVTRIWLRSTTKLAPFAKKGKQETTRAPARIKSLEAAPCAILRSSVMDLEIQI